MVVRLGEVVGEVAPTVQIKSVAHEDAEESFFAACRLIPLKAASLVLAGSCPEVGGLGKRDADFLVADGGWMVRKKAKIGIHPEHRESEPRWTSMH